jgi:hypothetical protein
MKEEGKGSSRRRSPKPSGQWTPTPKIALLALLGAHRRPGASSGTTGQFYALFFLHRPRSSSTSVAGQLWA